MDLPSKKVKHKNRAIGLLADKTQQAIEQYGPKAKELGQQGLQLLDRLAAVVVDSKSGEQKGYFLQTVLDLVGLPTVLSVGDLMGALRGYKNVRDGYVARGVIEFVTAVVPGIPTGPAHKAIDIGIKVVNDESMGIKILTAFGISAFLVIIEIAVVIFFQRDAPTISLIIAVIWVLSVIGTFLSKLGENRT
jgi:hypothetical protein